MRLSVLETPDLITPQRVHGTVSIVIDVLRATSSIACALSSGCVRLIPATDREHALSLKASHPGAILTGEIGGRKIPGFDLGNSPYEYTPESVGGKEVIMTTSNGTKAIVKTGHAGSKTIFLAAFLNMSKVARAVYELLKSGRYPGVSLVCSGSHGQFSPEDFACAGAIAGALVGLHEDNASIAPELTSETRQAIDFFSRYRGDVIKILRDSDHGQYLESIGFGNDLKICSQVDKKDVVPQVADGAVVAYRENNKMGSGVTL